MLTIVHPRVAYTDLLDKAKLDPAYLLPALLALRGASPWLEDFREEDFFDEDSGDVLFDWTRLLERWQLKIQQEPRLRSLILAAVASWVGIGDGSLEEGCKDLDIPYSDPGSILWDHGLDDCRKDLVGTWATCVLYGYETPYATIDHAIALLNQPEA